MILWPYYANFHIYVMYTEKSLLYQKPESMITFFGNEGQRLLMTTTIHNGTAIKERRKVLSRSLKSAPKIMYTQTLGVDL